ncbi:MAG TPA: glycosyltransferase [Gaiellaceae bacterium]|jgi:glycosyltransferase involved in cell wall biosynthesis
MAASLSEPRVSVVLPVRDGGSHLEQAVESILGQTFDDLELVAVDDGSTDETPRILSALAARDRRVRVQRLEPTGLVAALNAGIGQARGVYVARMDADDVSLPRRLELQVAELDARPALGVLGTQVRYINAGGSAIGVWRLPVGEALVRWSLFFGTALAHPSVMARRELLVAHVYRAEAPHAEDYDLWARLSTQTELDNLPDLLFERRVHGASVSDLNEADQIETSLRVQGEVIGRALGQVPSSAQLRALRTPRTPFEAFAAVRLTMRLLYASPRTPEVRRDAVRRSSSALRSGFRRR